MSGALDAPSSPNLLSANTTLLQPGSGYFRLFDALWMINNQNASAGDLGPQVAVLQTQVAQLNTSISTLQGQIGTINTTLTSLQGQITTINTTLTSLQGQINTLQGNIATINGRLTAAGIP